MPAPQHFSQAYRLKAKEGELDFFDTNLAFDTRLFVDPFLIKRSPLKAERDLFNRFGIFFSAAYEKSIKGDRARIDELGEFFNFHEPKEVYLGFTEASNEGAGPGTSFSAALFHFFLKNTLKEIVVQKNLYPEGKFNPTVLSLVMDRVGQDGISDISVNLIMDYLISYTQKQCKEWAVPTRILPVQQTFDYASMSWTNGVNVRLPENPLRPGEPVVLVPKRFLRGEAVEYTGDIKKRIRGILQTDDELAGKFASLLKEPVSAINTKDIQRVLRQKNSILKQYLEVEEQRDFKPYDFEKDPIGFFAIKRFAGLFKKPDSASREKTETCEDLFNFAKKFVYMCKEQLERQSGWKKMWHQVGKNYTKPHRENVLGNHVRGLGFAYFYHYPEITFDVEIDSGSGRMDFRITRLDCKVVMELKNIINNTATGIPPLPAYFHGVKRQLPEYIFDTKAKYAIYLTGQHLRDDKGVHDARVNQIISGLNAIEKEIKQRVTDFKELYYVNFDLTVKVPPSQR